MLEFENGQDLDFWRERCLRHEEILRTLASIKGTSEVSQEEFGANMFFFVAKLRKAAIKSLNYTQESPNDKEIESKINDKKLIEDSGRIKSEALAGTTMDGLLPDTRDAEAQPQV